MSKFIYDIKTSSLYAPNGKFLKTLYCPKAKHWNQLIADDIEDRSRGCADCKERVLSLDKIPSEDSERIKSLRSECVYIPSDSNNVIFLEDTNALPSLDHLQSDENGVLIIKTARTFHDINRAAGMGYWPDVRLIKYKDEYFVNRELRTAKKDGASPRVKTNLSTAINSKFSIGQNTVSGQIKMSGDLRQGFARYEEQISDFPSFLRCEQTVPEHKESGFYKQVIPFTRYYEHYQSIPIAAYLIPPDLTDGTKVIVEDPIEDFVGGSWNQGDVDRAYNVKGVIKDGKVKLQPRTIKRADYIG